MISMYYYNNMIIIHQYSEAHDYYESVHLQEIMCQYLEVRAYYENINMILYARTVTVTVKYMNILCQYSTMIIIQHCSEVHVYYVSAE